jgi:hypothetical protein
MILSSEAIDLLQNLIQLIFESSYFQIFIGYDHVHLGMLDMLRY